MRGFAKTGAAATRVAGEVKSRTQSAASVGRIRNSAQLNFGGFNKFGGGIRRGTFTRIASIIELRHEELSDMSSRTFIFLGASTEHCDVIQHSGQRQNRHRDWNQGANQSRPRRK